MRFITLTLMGLLIIAVFSSLFSHPKNKPTTSSHNEFDRRTATASCMQFIKQILHDPDSAKFEHSDLATGWLEENKAMIIRNVSSKNGFNATRKNQFICFMELINGDIMPILIAEQGSHKDEIKNLIKEWDIQ
jgi:hypothetical protein